MTAQALITLIRARLRDEEAAGYTNANLLDYLNESLTAMYMQFADSGNPNYAKETTVFPYSDVPTDWYKAAGQYPVSVAGGKFDVIGADMLTLRYHPYPARLALEDTVPLMDGELPQLEERVYLLALRRHEFDVSQDVPFLQELKGRVEGGGQ